MSGELVERSEYNKLAEYAGAAIRDGQRYRQALAEIESQAKAEAQEAAGSCFPSMDVDKWESVANTARKALRQWTPDLHKHPGAG